MTGPAPAFYKIFVRDLDAGVAFYRGCLGFQEQRRIDAGSFDEVILAPARKGASLVLCCWKDGRSLELGNATGPMGFMVREVDAVADAMIAAGASTVIAPVDYHGARIAILADPDGHQIELIATPAA